MESKTFDYDKMKLEKIPCNLCGVDSYAVLARRASNGLAAQTCMCRNCGLIYINPRMTKEGYDEYYKYFYRHDREQAKGKEQNKDVEANFEAARRFGFALANRLKQYIRSGLTIDIGSSAGGVLYGLKEAIPSLLVVGVEPSIEESQFANQKGIKTYNYLFENLPEKEIGLATNILCVRSLNHLLDPKNFFQRCFNHLENEGYLILSVKNFRHQVRRAGSVVAGVQIDHPFMFTPETLRLFVESVGFEVRYLDVDEEKSEVALYWQREEGLSRHHIWLVAQKPSSSKTAIKAAQPHVYRKLRIQFWKPYVKVYYWIFYSHRLGFLRRLLGS
jgi:SAM-dependent methyltransferase